MEKLQLFHNKSVLHKLNYKIGNTVIYMKRDDTLDFAFGGNKVRLYEYIAKKIVESNVKRVVTYGSRYSNFLRVTAAVCSMLKTECDLIILDGEDNSNGGNEVILKFYKANIIHCDIAKAHKFIDEYQKKLNDANIKYLWVPGGGHVVEAGFAYDEVARELNEDWMQIPHGGDEYSVFVPCGTGTTQAGLIYGFNCTKIKVYGITIARHPERCISEIKTILDGMLRLEHKEYKNFEINVLDTNSRRYGENNDKISQIIKDIALTDGIYLDPIYNAPAFCGMKTFLEQHTNLNNVIYVNTGGTPNIFLNNMNL